MKLKTLKDFRLELMNGDVYLHAVWKKDLKQEAIKWYHRSDDDKHKFIREFFNITKEELKGGNQDGNKTRKD